MDDQWPISHLSTFEDPFFIYFSPFRFFRETSSTIIKNMKEKIKTEELFGKKEMLLKILFAFKHQESRVAFGFVGVEGRSRTVVGG